MNNEKIDDFPEKDYFMNESLSDIVFVIEGQRLPATKALLMIKNRVFRAMFSDNFKESKDKEVVIKETTFEAFKTLIWFLYSDQIVLKDSKDLKFIGELYKLCDRFEALRLMARIKRHLIELLDCLSADPIEFQKLISLLRIAKAYDIVLN